MSGPLDYTSYFSGLTDRANQNQFVDSNSNLTAQIRSSSNDLSGPIGTSVTSQIVDGLCEGPIEGWPTSDPFKHIYLDGTPVKSFNSTINLGGLRIELKTGTSNQNPLSQYTIIGAVKAPNFQAELDDIAKVGGSGAITQQVQIRDDTDGAYPPVEAIAFTFNFPEGLYRFKSSGGRSTTPVAIKIEVNNKADATGTWFEAINDMRTAEITSGGFDITYVVELPPGWSTNTGVQLYSSSTFVDDIITFRISKYNSDHTNDRAHSKVYLKSYSIYTRNQLSYPYTALSGITIDSINFDGSIPRRQYDLKLLKVKVPSNYKLSFGSDGNVVERNYVGQWDGTFTNGVWTDNPVWCFYDLVTNERYGLGKYIDSSLLNKWKLYEIAKYCDAVVADTRPTYPSVPNGTSTVAGTSVPANSYTYSSISSLGGVSAGSAGGSINEPRFTCNVLISSREEAYSLVQKMASLFRSIVFFQQGTVNIIQDRPSTPVHLYNNTNVIGGVFSYSSSGAKARHTVAIVKWLDPNDLYSEKTEYVEDYDGISRYGYREIEIDGFGCTSRGQARRLGRHILITEKFELETISFKTGIEGGILTPGNLIKVKDSDRQIKRAGGRIVSATSNSITIDRALDIPAGATSILLWVQTPTALNEIIDSSTEAVYKPTLTSHSITSAAGSTGITTFTLSSGTFSTTPANGNLWALSYTPSGSTENTSVYKILSVVENNAYEYEITALQHRAEKYDEIEAYEPIPQYTPKPLSYFVQPPDRGWVSSSAGKTPGKFNLKIIWETDKYVSGTKYKLEVVLADGRKKILVNGTTLTSYDYEDVGPGIYYFNVYTLNNFSRVSSEALVLGPHIIRESLPQNTFSSFSQTGITDNSITNTWPTDLYSNDLIAYELWRNNTDSLRTFETSKTVRSISGNNITLNSFDITGLGSPDSYRLETPILPIFAYTATNINSFGVTANTSTSLVAVTSLEKPNVSIGDKLINTTRSVATSPTFTNITSVTQTKAANGIWYTRLGVNPAIASQTSGDVVYFYKGIMGVGLIEKQPSAAIGQKIITATGATSPTSIVGASGAFTNVLTGDIIVNKSRGSASRIVTKISNTQLTVSSISGQTAGDKISFYQANTREPRLLKKFKIDYLYTAFGADKVLIKDFTDSTYTPEPDKTIIVNLTRNKAAEVHQVSNNEIIYFPAIAGTADDDEIIFIPKSQVYTASSNIHIHPTAGVAAAGTTSTKVICTGLFTSAAVGDIVVNATRNTSTIIYNKISNNEVDLVASAAASTAKWAINGQTSGDVVFVITASSIASTFNEYLRYDYPTIYTTSPTTNTNTVTATGAFSGVTTSYRLYNVTRNTSATISSATTNTLTISPPITGQTSGDLVYAFLPTQTTGTIVTAPDGAFKDARPGDLFWNITRDKTAVIKDVTTLTGVRDKRIDRLVLANEISPQSAGDAFLIYQGWQSAIPTAFTNNGSNDIITVDNVSNFKVGDRVYLYKMNATNIGTTTATSFTDNGLSPASTYYYWVRATNAKVRSIVGQWIPSSINGDPATTQPSGIENYNSSNDNNADPITIAITPGTPAIDLPPGGRNADSTANIRLYWEWTGRPRDLDGFVVYFWTSNSATDDGTINEDNDYVRATTNYIAPVNPRIGISSLTYISTAITVNTSGPHDLVTGDKVRIIGVKNTSGSNLPNVNNTTASGTDYFTITRISDTQFTFTALAAPTGSHQSGTGWVTSCEYSYQINNLTANYYYNAWIQPYRSVNTTISENGILVGSPVKLYS